MFSGIVEGTGLIVSRAGRTETDGARAERLRIDLGDLAADARLGASIAINGVCLTVAELAGKLADFDVIPETLRRTNLGGVRPGQRVNLERSLKVGDRIDGHFVQGHVDGTAEIEEIDRLGGGWKVWLATPAELAAYIVEKGSITLDGVSLTLADVMSRRFSVALIPTTLQRTTLGERKTGDRVNVESDILARIVVERLNAGVGRENWGSILGGVLEGGLSI